MTDATPRDTIPTNTPTRYEVALDGPHTDEPIVIGFTPRRSNRGLLDLARRHADAILDVIGSDANADASLTGGVLTMGAHRVRFTGRTERTAAALASDQDDASN